VNNLNELWTDNVCLGQAWYLANDFQFFLAAPVFALWFSVAFRRVQPTKIRRWMELYALPCIALLVYCILIYNKVNSFKSIKGEVWGSAGLYTRPEFRYSPYAIGILLAMIHFERTEQAKKSENPEHWRNLFQNIAYDHLMFVFAFGCMVFIALIEYGDMKCKLPGESCTLWYAFYNVGANHPTNWGKWQVMLFAIFRIPLWTFAVAYICYYLFRGHGFVINEILSSKVFTPLSRLTYNVYMLHMMLITTYMTSKTTSIEFGLISNLMVYCYILFVSLLSSLFVFLIVEKPLLNVTVLLLRRPRKALETFPERTIELEQQVNQQMQAVTDVDEEAMLIVPMPPSSTATPVTSSAAEAEAVVVENHINLEAPLLRQPS
jgi:peptidoglycan/LPS O-acetylase OafA/YrhL